MTPKRSQGERILEHLQHYGPLTPIDALELYGCFRLSARILDLKESGHNIKIEIKKLKNGKKVAVYSIPKIQVQGELKL